MPRFENPTGIRQVSDLINAPNTFSVIVAVLAPQLLINIVLLIAVGAAGFSTQRIIWRGRITRPPVPLSPWRRPRRASPPPGRLSQVSGGIIAGLPGPELFLARR
jgi:hypothetical protein